MAESALVLHIDNIAFGGDGIGRLPSGKVVFIAGAFPGDTVSIEIQEERRGFARARILEVLTPAPERVEPACSVADRCGGCSFWRIEPAAEWAWKQKSALEALARISRLDLEQVEIKAIDAPSHTRYRRRIRLHLGGKGKLGFFAPSSHTVTPLTDCLVADAALVEAAHSLKGVIPKGFRGDLLLERDHGSDAVVGVLYLKTTRAQDIQAAVAALKTLIESKSGPIAGVRVLSDEDRTMQPGQAGKIEFSTHVLGQEHRLKAGVFTQANDAMNAVLIAEAIKGLALTPKDCVLELYCGWGNFSVEMAKSGAEVQGFEMAERAIALGKQNAVRILGQHPKAGKLTLSVRDLTRGLPNKHVRQGRYSKVLLDPPRSGAAEVMSGLLKLAPERIVYVSCNPTTLGRDLKRLVTGYDLRSLTMLDMFPRTSHVETIAVLDAKT